MSSTTNEASLCLSKGRTHRLSNGFILFGQTMQDTLRVPHYLPSLRQGLFLFSLCFLKKKRRNYRCCHPLTGTPVCSHGKCKKGPSLRLTLPVRGGQVTKQMFTVFLRMICSLLRIDSGPTTTINSAALEWAEKCTMLESGVCDLL